MKNSLSNSQFHRFLKLLKIEPEQPGNKNLHAVVLAYMKRVPFENISKLYYKKTLNLLKLPDTDQYLDGIEKCNFGGTCYSNNYYINLLLNKLGYDTVLCGADMNNPDCHLVNMVSIEGKEFLIDTGYGAPFVKPLRRDLIVELEICHGRDRYVLHPKDINGNSRLDLYRDGKLTHGYTAKPIPRTIDFFAGQIDGSFSDTATFMNCLLVVRQFENRSVVIYNTTLTESEGKEYRVTQLKNRQELPVVIEKYMNIPQTIVSEVLPGIGELKSPWN